MPLKRKGWVNIWRYIHDSIAHSTCAQMSKNGQDDALPTATRKYPGHTRIIRRNLLKSAAIRNSFLWNTSSSFIISRSEETDTAYHRNPSLV